MCVCEYIIVWVTYSNSQRVLQVERRASRTGFEIDWSLDFPRDVKSHILRPIPHSQLCPKTQSNFYNNLYNNLEGFLKAIPMAINYIFA